MRQNGFSTLCEYPWTSRRSSHHTYWQLSETPQYYGKNTWLTKDCFYYVRTFLNPKWLSGVFCYEENFEQLSEVKCLELKPLRIEGLIMLEQSLKEIIGYFCWLYFCQVILIQINFAL